MDRLDVAVDLAQLPDHGFELLASKSLPARESTVVVSALLCEASAYRTTQRWRVQGCCCGAAAHQVLMHV